MPKRKVQLRVIVRFKVRNCTSFPHYYSNGFLTITYLKNLNLCGEVEQDINCYLMLACFSTFILKIIIYCMF